MGLLKTIEPMKDKSKMYPVYSSFKEERNLGLKNITVLDGKIYGR